MKKLLITGFDPFGGESINPAWEAVKRLPDAVGEWELTKLEIPTVFGVAAQKVLARAEEVQPDAILCIGQAGGRKAITPEMVGINLQASGAFADLISRNSAIMWPLAVTGACLVLMFFSKKALFPWAVSIFTLVLPILLLFSNAYPM